MLFSHCTQHMRHFWTLSKAEFLLVVIVTKCLFAGFRETTTIGRTEKTRREQDFISSTTTTAATAAAATKYIKVNFDPTTQWPILGCASLTNSNRNSSRNCQIASQSFQRPTHPRTSMATNTSRTPRLCRCHGNPSIQQQFTTSLPRSHALNSTRSGGYAPHADLGTQRVS